MRINGLNKMKPCYLKGMRLKRVREKLDRKRLTKIRIN